MNTPNNLSVAVHYMRMLTDYADRHGLATESLLQQAGIDSKILDDPNDRVLYSDFAHACEMAAQLLEEPHLGLKLGRSVRPGHLGSHGVALMSCADGKALLKQSARYSALTIDAGFNEFDFEGEECIRYWRSKLPSGSALAPLQNELHQASALTLVQTFVNRFDLHPHWVSFEHKQPKDTTLFEEVFQCELRFEAKDTAIGFDKRFLDIPLPHADSQLRRIMDDLCKRLLAQAGDALEPNWLGQARKYILDSFQQGNPSLEAVAAEIKLSTEEFKKNLSDRGMSFRSLVDELRKSLALGYIRDPNLTLVDIAYLLGFSEQSAFQRAFKRWTLMTPGEYRQSKD